MNKNIIFKIIEKLDRIISEKRQVGFCSVPDYTNNAYALFKYMVKNKTTVHYKKKFKQ
jgi:hypothetical protein